MIDTFVLIKDRGDVIDQFPYIVDSLISLTRWLLSKIGSRVFFFPMAPSSAPSGRRARLAACKDAARRQTRRATSEYVARYCPWVLRALSVSWLFYSEVLLT